jgi:hypothetical protein
MFIYKKNLSALDRLRQEECEFEASLGYTGRSCLKKQQQQQKKKKQKPQAGM